VSVVLLRPTACLKWLLTMAEPSGRLETVLARCKRIHHGAEALPNLPPHLAERLKALYSRCERLKQQQPHPDGLVEVSEDGDELGSDEDIAAALRTGAAEGGESPRCAELAMTDPYMLPGEVEAETVDADASDPDPELEPSSAPSQVAQDAPTGSTQQGEVCAWNDLPPEAVFALDQVRYTVERKLGQSQGSVVYAIRSEKGEGFVAKMEAQGPLAAARRLANNQLEMEQVTVDIFEVTSFVQTLTQVLSDFGLSEKAPGPASLPGAPPAAPEAAPATPEAAPGPRPESGPAMLVPAANQQPTFKVLFASERPRKQEDEQSECSEPENATLAPAFPKMPAFSKAKPQDPPTLSSLLDSYAEEEAPSPQEVVELSDPEEAPAEGPKALTPSGAKARAEARRAKAKAHVEEESVFDDVLPEVVVEAPAEGASLTWDPATGQFRQEEIPAEIVEEFRRKPDFNLEDYQERVLMAQLQEKKRRLQQQQEERERRRRRLEEEAQRRERVMANALASYVQEAVPLSTPPDPGEAAMEPVEPKPPEPPQPPQDPQLQTQLLQAHALQLHAWGQLQAQQLAAWALLQSRDPAAAGASPLAQHLGLAAQIHAWMAGAYSSQ
ncbi:unnamed protein product, partial [Effrenium voratum]